MSARKLYERLVGLIFTKWAALYPMAEWVDPESAVDRIVAELLEKRRSESK